MLLPFIPNISASLQRLVRWRIFCCFSALWFADMSDVRNCVSYGRHMRRLFVLRGGVFLGCFILLIAFFTSRGEFHTDTNIYHAAAIRLYEEYGVLKGAGNLQLHYAYNSAYLAFASIFSLRWLFGQSIHTTTGFLEVIMCLYAFYGLKEFKRHKRHMTDMMKVGILFYTLVNMTRSMSPATDYAVMYFVLFIITAWCEQFEFGGVQTMSRIFCSLWPQYLRLRLNFQLVCSF